jgi:four helix bundle protein
MSRDHTKLRVFQFADALATCIYRETAVFPPGERFGLQAQLRRAAVSVSANIVEGSARRSQSDYLRFLEIALGSACEVDYLVDLSRRLGFMTEDGAPLQILHPTRDSVAAKTDQLSRLSP